MRNAFEGIYRLLQLILLRLLNISPENSLFRRTLLSILNYTATIQLFFFKLEEH